MSELVERDEAVTFRGQQVTLIGPELQVSDPAPDFTVVAGDMSPVTLASSAGTVRVFSAVPSLETPVCDQQTRHFTKALAERDGVQVVTVSVDLPFAQQRWCGAAGLPDAITVSDHRDVSFGTAYGVLIAQFRLLARAVFVVAAEDVVRYAQYVPEVTDLPDFDAALAAVDALRPAAAA